jgi:large subunit ribosomal protein L25
MTHSQLTVKPRTFFGNQAKKLYKQGLTPGIIYGNVKEPIAVEFLVSDFLKLYKAAGENHVVDLNVDGGNTIPAIIHDLDIHPVTRKLRNVDFKAVDLKKKTTAEVPVVLVGIAPVVKTMGGLVVIKLTQIEVEALPEKIPETIQVDISKLETLDDNVFVKDLIIDGDFVILDDKELPVVVVETESEEVIEDTTPIAGEDSAVDTTTKQS